MIQPALLLRREFLRCALAAAGGVSVLPSLRSAPASPIVIGLSQYSLRRLFQDGTLDPLDYPAFAREKFGIAEIDLWEGGLPKHRLDDDSYLAALRERAVAAGTHLFLLMAGVLDATAPAGSERRAGAAELFPSVERAGLLGCEYLRVFLKADDSERNDAFAPCADSLGVLADRAHSRDVCIVIEPGSSKLTRDGAFLAEVMQRFRHSHCRLMPDFGKLSGDVYEGTRAMMPYAAVVSAKTHEFDASGSQIDFDYFRLMRIITAAQFRGIVAIEWEGRGLDPIAGILASKALIERALAAA